MASKKKIENDKTKINKLSLGIKEETKHGIYALISFVLALFFVLGAFHGAGRAGIFFYTLFSFLSAYLLYVRSGPMLAGRIAYHLCYFFLRALA